MFTLATLAADLRSAPAAECYSIKGNDRSYWSWRIIDGRKCWYRGPSNKPKSELHWPITGPAGTVEQRQEAVDTPPHSGAVATETSWKAAPADQLLAFTCCWPPLEPAATSPPQDDATVAQPARLPAPIVMPPTPAMRANTPPVVWILVLVLFVALSWLIWDFTERQRRRR